MNHTAPIPDGYRQDHEGRLIPLANIREIDLTRDGLVIEIFTKLSAHAEATRKLRQQTLDDVAAFISLSAERFGVSVGGEKGNVCLTSFDGRYKLQRQVSDNIVFDEGLQAAKALIDECIRAWIADGTNPHIATLVQDAFQVNKAGRINTGRVLGLRRHNIDDERWKRAMQAISESVRTSSTSTYIRCYERDAHGEYQPVANGLGGG